MNVSISLDLSTIAVLGREIASSLNSSGVRFTTAEILDDQRAATPWFTSAEAADYLRIGRTELQRLAASGAVPSEQDVPGGKRYFHRDELDTWRRCGGQR